MMREFHRSSQLDGILVHKFLRILLGVDQHKQALGTIQDAAAHEQSTSSTLPGSIAKPAELIEDHTMRIGLVNYYRMYAAQVHFPRNTDPPDNSEPLGSYAECFHYGLLDGRKIRSINHPESKHTSIGSSIIQIQFRENIFAGEVLTIFRHKQDGVLDPDLRN
ncbi:hypothetical protein B0H14DRAFT_2741910 [Mycena olivaceomarginata]|nr:hypothetical protein B0H14DRAFT_2741910 [Mycena olivaceomarginata]